MKSLLWLASVLLSAAGCSHGPAAAPAPRAGAFAAVPVPATPGPASSYAAEYEEYYVGVLPGEDPSFAYQPGTLRVQTRPARFRFQGASTDPLHTPRDPNFHPDATALEIDSALARASKTIARLTDENAALSDKLKAAATPAAAADEHVPLPAALAAASPAPAADASVLPPPPPPAEGAPAAAPADLVPEGELNYIQPNADYAIELDPDYFADPGPVTSNPFVQRYQPHVELREIALEVSAAIPGPTPSAILNDRTVNLGDTFEGLTVHAIDADRVVLRKGSFLLLCPVSDRVLKLRLP